MLLNRITAGIYNYLHDTTSTLSQLPRAQCSNLGPSPWASKFLLFIMRASLGEKGNAAVPWIECFRWIRKCFCFGTRFLRAHQVLIHPKFLPLHQARLLRKNQLPCASSWTVSKPTIPVPRLSADKSNVPKSLTTVLHVPRSLFSLLRRPLKTEPLVGWFPPIPCVLNALEKWASRVPTFRTCPLASGEERIPLLVHYRARRGIHQYARGEQGCYRLSEPILFQCSGLECGRAGKQTAQTL